MIISDLIPDILGRLEEDVENGPIFWSLVGEIYPQIVDGMFEASLITGLVQFNDIPIQISPGTTYFSILGSQYGYGNGGYGNGGYGGNLVPTGTLGVIRMKAPWPIRKTTLNGLDAMFPNWQQADPSDQIISWFPLGLSGFGIYPQTIDQIQVTVDVIASPVNEFRPYTGNETIPFQTEFNDAFSQYAATMLRMKEGGEDAEEADSVYQQYLGKMKALSLFQSRVDSLIFSSAFGVRNYVNPRTIV
jgi:hypothetical protein